MCSHQNPAWPSFTPDECKSFRVCKRLIFNRTDLSSCLSPLSFVSLPFEHGRRARAPAHPGKDVKDGVSDTLAT